jgi:hypothetical protein
MDPLGADPLYEQTAAVLAGRIAAACERESVTGQLAVRGAGPGRLAA